MGDTDTDKVFAGAIPKVYDTYLVPLIFEHYALDMANRFRSHSPVFEIAAGTGVVTRAFNSSRFSDYLMILFAYDLVFF
jgi:hypothetical protein